MNFVRALKKVGRDEIRRKSNAGNDGQYGKFFVELVTLLAFREICLDVDWNIEEPKS